VLSHDEDLQDVEEKERRGEGDQLLLPHDRLPSQGLPPPDLVWREMGVAGWPHPAADVADRGGGRDEARWRRPAEEEAVRPAARGQRRKAAEGRK
jgi:hypothetical protein